MERTIYSFIPFGSIPPVLVALSKLKTAVIAGRIELIRSPAKTLTIGTFTEPLACLLHYGTSRRQVSLGLVPWFLGAAGLRSASSNPPTLDYFLYGIQKKGKQKTSTNGFSSFGLGICDHHLSDRNLLQARTEMIYGHDDSYMLGSITLYLR